MLSGNGRHRRPRQAPALIVAAGVAGSAIAIPLLGATSASAASTATWDKLAECESGGSWSADAGNGYYGGLQLSQQTWEDFGGLDYAPSADQASRSQQISVAEKVLDDQGAKAWPSCAPIAGLTQDGAAADVDPGAPIPLVPSDEADEPEAGKTSDDPSDSATPSEKSSDESSDEPSGESSKKPSDESSEKPADDGETRDKNHDDADKSDGSDGSRDSGGSDDSGKSGQDDTTSPTPGTTPSTGEDEGAGRHRGGSADDERAGTGDRDGSGRHASRGDERQQDGSDGTYTVRSGDNLSVIADDLDVDGGWTELYAENEKSVGSDPDLILPGQSLDLGEK